MTEKKKRRPGDPYEVGYGKTPKHTRFKRGRSGNPYGRPPKKPDLYSELTKVLRGKVTLTQDGQPEEATVQQALLLRLRDEALRGELWAVKLVQDVMEAMPDHGGVYDRIDREVGLFRAMELLALIAEKSDRENADQNPDQMETDIGK